MRPDEIESNRYKKSDHCEIHLEEKIMFQFLKDFSKNKNISEIKVLDIGCGSGKITKTIQNRGYDVCGLDFSEEAIKKARQLGIKANLCNLDNGIIADDNSYSVLWAGDIIEHVFDPIGLLKESHRVLKDGSIILMTIPSDVGLISRIRILFGQSYQVAMYKSSGYYKHHTFFNMALIKFMLRKSGFEIVGVKKILIIGSSRINADWAPSAFYNEMVICAKKI
jgi:2-polyprenyl-3-methyl-5-hydroxy-6-metoxy-1,4-benzoquinol methylase